MDDWERYLSFRSQFETVLDPRFYPIAWLDAQVFAGFARIIAEDDAAVLYSIKTYPGGASAIHGLVAVGNLETIIGSIRPRFEHAGKELGCLVAEVESRGGWERTLGPFGYEKHQICMRKEL